MWPMLLRRPQAADVRRVCVQCECVTRLVSRERHPSMKACMKGPPASVGDVRRARASRGCDAPLAVRRQWLPRKALFLVLRFVRAERSWMIFVSTCSRNKVHPQPQPRSSAAPTSVTEVEVGCTATSRPWPRLTFVILVEAGVHFMLSRDSALI
ncbi:hypothetical protein BD413DRAFT_233138 [Trametes elegans]|nr:hypothetical protein BD413DRAFT_233138 [Trametes elegans]